MAACYECRKLVRRRDGCYCVATGNEVRIEDGLTVLANNIKCNKFSPVPELDKILFIEEEV